MKTIFIRFASCSILFGFVSAAYAYLESIQLTPATLANVPGILIRSNLDTTHNHDIYWVAILPGSATLTNLSGILSLRESTNVVPLVQCPIAARILTIPPHSEVWSNGIDREYYHALTNKFSRPLEGAKLFTFTVSTNLLTSSDFVLEDNDFELAISFRLFDFAAH